LKSKKIAFANEILEIKLKQQKMDIQKARMQEDNMAIINQLQRARRDGTTITA
jgi:hypothetical protein